MRICDWSSDVCSSDLFQRTGELERVDSLAEAAATGLHRAALDTHHWCTERIVDAVLADLDRLRLHAGVRAGTKNDRHCRQQLLGTAVVVRGRGGETEFVGDLALTAATGRVTLLRGKQVVQRPKVTVVSGTATRTTVGSALARYVR